MKERVVVLLTVFGIVASLVLGTVYKVYNIHLNRSYLVVEKRIIEGAEACVFDNKCNDEDMTLGVLISKGYASDEINPKTSLYYDRDSLIKKVNGTFVFEGH